jgi:hypothetical protein
MKKSYAIQIALIACMCFIGCAKTGEPITVRPLRTNYSIPYGGGSSSTTINPGPGDTYIQVLEYYTNIPVAFANYSRNFCTELNDTGCVSPRYGNIWETNSDGIIYIQAPDSLEAPNSGERVTDLFSKQNYWDRNGFDSLYTQDSIKKAVTRIFPVAWLKIHLKSAFYRTNTVNTVMHFDVSSGDTYIPGPVPSKPFIQYHSLSLPTNNLDTTIIIKTFAYATNELEIDHDTVDAQLNHFYYSVYHEKQTISRFDTLHWEVIVK